MEAFAELCALDPFDEVEPLADLADRAREEIEYLMQYPAREASGELTWAGRRYHALMDELRMREQQPGAYWLDALDQRAAWYARQAEVTSGE